MDVVQGVLVGQGREQLPPGGTWERDRGGLMRQIELPVGSQWGCLGV